MALAINSQETSGIAHHDTSGIVTWAFNNVAGTTLFVAVIATCTGATSTLGAVTYNSIPMTAVPSSLITWDTGASAAQWYYLNSPATGSNTVSVTTTFGGGSASADAIAAAISFTGADPTNPYGTPVTHANTTAHTSDSVTVTGTTNGNYVLSVIGNGAGGLAATSPNTLSALLDFSTNTGGDNFEMAQRTTSGGSVAAAFTFNSDINGMSAFEVIATTGTTTFHYNLGVNI